MSKNKTPSLPNTPQYYTDPLYAQGQQTLSGLGNDLTSFNFTGGLSPLADTVSFSPEMTRLALSFAQNSLTPEYQMNRQNSINDLANLGALESSTTSNAFAQQDYNLNSQMQAYANQAAMQDRTSALNNRLALFGQGLDTLQGVTNSAQQEGANRNQFDLTNYQNQVAKTLNDQKAQNGGFLGGLLGAGGGALAGLALAPFTGGSSLLLAGLGGLGGGLAGGFGSPGTGGQILGAGAGAYGMGASPGVNRVAGLTNLPGAYASNGGLSGSLGSSNSLYDKLFSAGGLN